MHDVARFFMLDRRWGAALPLLLRLAPLQLRLQARSIRRWPRSKPAEPMCGGSM